MITNILVALQEADPSHAAGYASNATAFVLRLRQLDGDIRSGLDSLTNRAFVTSHDAFHYFARRYGFTIAGVIEETAEVDPSPAHLTALRAAIQKHSVKALFVDTHTSPRRARQWGSDFKLTVGVLDTLEEAPLTRTAYEDGMRRNLRALQQAFR
jgi:ABC-type Zn uptake system ZnuABC Zn-binding protein ZnuA